MKKPALTILVALLGIAIPVMAQTTTQDIQSDTQAIHKDNTAIAHDNQNIQDNRAAKAVDKANGDYGKQAIDSVKIGANQTAHAEKETEKDADKHIMTHDEKNASQ